MADVPDPNRRKHKTQRPPLSAREIRFCQRLMETDESQYDAYLAVGYPPKETRRATEMAAHRLVKNRVVLAYLRTLQNHAAEAAKITVEELATGFKGAVDADVTALMGPDGEMLPPSEWPVEVKRHITRLEVEELTEMQPDPDNPRRKKKVAIGIKWKVWLENKTECRKVLAGWKRMIGADKPPDSDGDKPTGNTLVVIQGPVTIAPPADEPEESPG